MKRCGVRMQGKIASLLDAALMNDYDSLPPCILFVRCLGMAVAVSFLWTRGSPLLANNPCHPHPIIPHHPPPHLHALITRCPSTKTAVSFLWTRISLLLANNPCHPHPIIPHHPPPHLHALITRCPSTKTAVSFLWTRRSPLLVRSWLFWRLPSGATTPCSSWLRILSRRHWPR